MTVVSTSGIRGIFNLDLLPEESAEYAKNFVHMLGAQEVLIGRDTRATGEVGSRVVTGAVLGTGTDLAG